MENDGGCSLALFYSILRRIFTHGDPKKYEVQINHHKSLHCYLYQSQSIRDAKLVCNPMRRFPVKCCDWRTFIVHRRSESEEDDNERHSTMDVFSGYETERQKVLFFHEEYSYVQFKIWARR